MKNILFFCLTVIASVLLTGCSQEDTISLSNEKVHSFEELSVSIDLLNQKYAKCALLSDSVESATEPKKAKAWFWFGRIISSVAADVAGSLSGSPSGVSVNIKQGIDSSISIWKMWEMKSEPENEPNNDLKNDSSSVAPKRPAQLKSGNIVINTTSVPQINGRFIEDNAGYIHNKVIIDLYEELGDELKNISADDLAVYISREYETVIKDAGLVSKCQSEQVIDRSVVNQICELASNCDDVTEFIASLKKKYPMCAQELDILENAMQMIMSQELEEEQIDNYTRDVIKTVGYSNIPNNSKNIIKATVGVSAASSQLWVK